MSLLQAAAVGPGAAATRLTAPQARFGDVLRATAGAPGARPQRAARPIQAALDSIEAARRRLDGALDAARAGRVFSPAELIAMQGLAYRYSQTVELASKLVEQASATLRQTVNTQV